MRWGSFLDFRIRLLGFCLPLWISRSADWSGPAAARWHVAPLPGLTGTLALP